MSLEIATAGFMFKNPKPHVRSLHAYFPSVVRYPDGELVAFMIRQHRQRLDEGLNNPATGGYVEQDLWQRAHLVLGR